MKPIHILTLLLLLFIAPSAKASSLFTEEFSQSIVKTASINANAIVDIQNKFGKLITNTWSKNEVEINYTIKVEAGSQAEANEIINQIKIDFTASPDFVSAITNLDFIDKIRTKHNITIDVMVKIPNTVFYKVSNKFGDTYLNDFSGQIEANSKYGDLHATLLKHQNNAIEVGFGKAFIQSFNGGRIKVNYGELKIEKVATLKLRSRFSDVELGSVGTITIDSQYDDIEIERAEYLTADNQFTDFEIKLAIYSINLTNRYGGFSCDLFSNQANELFIDTQFGGIEIELESEVSFTVNGSAKFGSIEFDDDDNVRERSDNTGINKSYSGSVGPKSPSFTATLTTAYGTIEIED